MAPNKRQRSTKEVGKSSQAPTSPQRTSRMSTNMCARGHILHPLGLTHPIYVARYNYLNEHVIVVTRHYDEDLLARLRMLDDIRWLFTRGGMSHFLELKEHTYRDLTLEFLSKLHI